MRLVVKVLAFALWGLVLIPSGTAAPRWGAPIVIAPPGGQESAFDHPYNPDVDMNQRGDVSVVWNTWEGQLGTINQAAVGSYELKERARRSGARDWSAPVNIGETNEPGYVRLDAAGNASVVYWGGYVRAADRGASEAQWLSQITVSPVPYGFIWQMSVDMNDRGDTVAAWTSSRSGSDVLEAALRLDGVWSAPVVLPTRSPDLFFTAAAIDSAGNAVVLWNDDGKIESAFRPKASGTWQPTEIGSGSEYDRVLVGFDAAGNATAEWESTTAYRPFGEAWSAPVSLRFRTWDLARRLAVCGNGDAVVLFVGSPTVFAAVRARNWTLTEVHTKVVYPGATAADVTCDEHGNAVAVWQEVGGIWSSVRPAGGAWEPATEVAPEYPESLSVALDGHGNAIAVWAHGLRQTIRLSELTPNGPILQELRLPRARAGIAARLSVAALPWGSPIQRVHWDFGDGTSANGAQVKHRYRRPGKYNVTVTARDASGSASLNRTVRVGRFRH